MCLDKSYTLTWMLALNSTTHQFILLSLQHCLVTDITVLAVRRAIAENKMVSTCSYTYVAEIQAQTAVCGA